MAINKYNKYNVWRRYKTYDSGKTWVAMDDYEAYQTEENAESCGYIPVTYRWVGVDGTMCNTDTHTLYSRTRQQASYDRGQTWDWTEPAVYNYGEVIEENSPQCGYPIYQWVDAVGEYLCGVDSNQYDKYQKEKRQVSTNNGDTWTDTGEERRGKIIEYSSFDCGFVPKWRWELTTEVCANEVPSYVESAISRTIDSGEVCKDGDKYTKEKIEISVDNGLNWGTTYPSDYIFKLKEKHSADCGYMEQWVNVNDNYYCDMDKHIKYWQERKQFSIDSGQTWSWIEPAEYRQGGVKENNSIDCGYCPPIVFESPSLFPNKYPQKDILIDNGVDTDKDGEISYCEAGSVTDIGTWFKEKSSVYGCPNDKALWVFNEFQFFTGVTEIKEDAFSGDDCLTKITLPSTIQKIGSGAFMNCKQVKAINIPSACTDLAESFAYPYDYPYALTGLNGLQTLKVEDGNTKYDSRDNCNALIVTSSNTLIFSSFNTVIPNTVKAIGFEALANVGSKNFVIPDSVERIGRMAFNGSNTNSIETIQIGTGCTFIDTGVFEKHEYGYLQNLTSIKFMGTTPPTLGGKYFSDVFFDYMAKMKVYVPKEALDDYCTKWHENKNDKVFGY